VCGHSVIEAVREREGVGGAAMFLYFEGPDISEFRVYVASDAKVA
jgi:hypothetical protein